MSGSILLLLVRQRVDAKSVLEWAVLLGVIYAFTRNISLIVWLLALLLVTETVDVLKTHPSVDERWVKVGLGGVLLAASGVWLWGELQEPTADRGLWLPVVAIGGSLWVLLDARADFVQGRRIEPPAAIDDLSATEAMLVMQHAQLVGQSLSEEPKTVDELAVDCDLTTSRVREAIAVVGRDGTIYPVDDANEPRYAVDDRQMGATGIGRLAAGGLTSLFRRLLRPFSNQF